MSREWFLFFAVVLMLGGGWLLMRDKKTQQQPSAEDEDYQLGREHALAGEKAYLATEAYRDGYSDGLKALQKGKRNGK